jgi:hypothetical protein
MASNSEWILGVLIVGVFIGLLIAKDVDSFAVEISPTNSLKAFVNFKPALPR